MVSRRAMRTIAVILLAFHVCLFMPTVAMAQYGPQQGAVPQTPSVITKVGEGNQYYLGQSNELLIRVNVWGRVQSPGQYFVPATTDLITLISMAGGPQNRSRLSDVRVVRAGTRSDPQPGEIIEVNVRKFLKTADKRLIPDLKPEDTIIVHGSIWQIVADVVLVTSQIATIASAYYWFFLADRSN